jgi:shikimate dehydrogenase
MGGAATDRGPARFAAVLGQPVAHSLSPALHRAAYAELGLLWTYQAIECGLGEFPARLAQAGSDCAGYSCTMPLKRAALAAAATASERARRAGAANTLLPAGDRTSRSWHADNTDVHGVLAALQECGVVPDGRKHVTLLGAGGAAQAVLVALAAGGADGCTVLVRDQARADDLVATAKRCSVAVDVASLHPNAAELDADLVISTLPAGAADPIAAGHAWRPRQLLFDVVYRPWPTPLAEAAKAHGASVISGALMLLHQAAAQVTLMTGAPAPIAAMRAALRAALPDCEA